MTGCEAMIENDRQWMAMVGHFGHDQLRRDGSLFRGLSAVDRCTWHASFLDRQGSGVGVGDEF